MFQERWFQSEAEFSFFDYMSKPNPGNPIIAMPTGTGKSVVIARIIRTMFANWPHVRVMMLTHDKKLIQQNAEKLVSFWPTAPIGVYSAGLKSRDFVQPILFGGLKSVIGAIKKDPLCFGHRDLILIDECHLLSPEDTTGYQKIIAALTQINPNLKVLGFSATPFRMKQGMLTEEGGLFTDICYDVTSFDAFNRLVLEGFIAPLIPKPTQTQIDLSAVKIKAGEYNLNQLQNATEEVTEAAVKETIYYGQDRRCWLLFAGGVENAEHVANMMQGFGVECYAVHSKLPEKVNDERIAAHRAGELRAIVNNGMLTTGYDNPPIDLIGMLRATLSPGLWVQMLGRGTRPFNFYDLSYEKQQEFWRFEGHVKRNCLVLDFARNTPRLGPINDPRIPRKPGKGGGEAPVRICEQCGVYNHASARQCCCCGTEFKFDIKIFKSACNDDLMRSSESEIKRLPVAKVIYNLHEKKNEAGELMSPPSIRVTYFAGVKRYDEWVCLEHQGLPGKRAKDWWRQRHAEEPPPTTFLALQRVSELRQPKFIRVKVSKGQYPEILGAEW